MPNGARRPSSSARSCPSSSPATTASTRSTRHQVLGRRAPPRRARANAARNASSEPRAIVHARRGAVPAVAQQVRARRRPARPAGRSAGIERPEPGAARRRRSAISTAGRWWRSAMREATMPMTPGCQSSPARTYAARSPVLGDLRLGLEQDPLSRRGGARRWRVELLGDLAARARRPRSAAARAPASARCRRPAALMRGASRKPSACASTPRRDRPRRRASARAARACSCARQRPQALAHEPPVLAAQRDAVGHRGQRDEVEVAGVGARRPAAASSAPASL